MLKKTNLFDKLVCFAVLENRDKWREDDDDPFHSKYLKKRRKYSMTGNENRKLWKYLHRWYQTDIVKHFHHITCIVPNFSDPLLPITNTILAQQKPSAHPFKQSTTKNLISFDKLFLFVVFDWKSWAYQMMTVVPSLRAAPFHKS